MINLKKYLYWLLDNQYINKKAYFIFEKGNGNKYIITSACGQFNHIGIGEITKEGEIVKSYIQGINVHNCTFYRNNKKYNPIIEISEYCQGLRYIKTIIDSRILIDHPYGYGKISPTCQWNWALSQK